MPENDIEKPTSRLFKSVPEHTYRAAFRALQELRAEHPEYRDDELLMFLLCKQIETRR